MEKRYYTQKEMDAERKSGFFTGIAFVAFMAVMTFISWAVVFAPMGWWL